MLKAPDTGPIDRAPLHSVLSMPYTLTPGRAAGAFMAEMANKRILGSRCEQCGSVSVPAQDFCPGCCGGAFELVEAPRTGTITAFTQTAAGLLAQIRIDGADFDLVHRVINADLSALQVGARVEAEWAVETQPGILAIKGFRLAPDAARGHIRPVVESVAQLPMQPYQMELHYRHAFGPFYGRLFDEIGNRRRIMGVRCTSCDSVLLPPREFCDICHVRTGPWVELPDTGVVKAMSVIHLEFKGQKEPPPYIYAEIQLDGAATRLIHSVKGLDMSRAAELVKPGTRVRAVWTEERTGSLSDISHFEPI